MSVFDFVQRHIDAIKHSVRNVESEKIYCFLYLLLESKGKIFCNNVITPVINNVNNNKGIKLSIHFKLDFFLVKIRITITTCYRFVR